MAIGSVSVLRRRALWGLLGLLAACASQRIAAHPEVLRAGADELAVTHTRGLAGRGSLCFGSWCADVHASGADMRDPQEDPVTMEQTTEVQGRVRFTFRAADGSPRDVSCLKRTVRADPSWSGSSAATRLLTCDVSPAARGQPQGRLEVRDAWDGKVARGELTLGGRTLEVESTRQLEEGKASTVRGFHLRAGTHWLASVATGGEGRVWMVKALAPEERDAAALVATALLVQGTWDDAGALERARLRKDRPLPPPASNGPPGKRAEDLLLPPAP